jgi:hypothetical protein
MKPEDPEQAVKWAQLGRLNLSDLHRGHLHRFQRVSGIQLGLWGPEVSRHRAFPFNTSSGQRFTICVCAGFASDVLADEDRELYPAPAHCLHRE